MKTAWYYKENNETKGKWYNWNHMKSIQSSQDIYFSGHSFFFQHQIQNYLILGFRDEAIEMVELAPAEMQAN